MPHLTREDGSVRFSTQNDTTKELFLKGGYIIFRFGSRLEQPCVYDNLEDAQQQLEHLAKNNPRTYFFILKAVALGVSEQIIIDTYVTKPV